jgi:hypothetical protein
MVKSRTSSRRKTKKKCNFSLSVKLWPKKVRAKFLIVYELNGCQKAVNFLSNYYKVTKLKIILNGRKVGNNYVGCYVDNKAYLKKEWSKR